MSKFIQRVSTISLLLATLFGLVSSAKLPAIVELHTAGLYGRVHAWNNIALKSHELNVKIPPNAPIIISDYHSKVGANGLKRSGKHRGIDIFARTGSPVIAAADGKVIKAKKDWCWGPTVLVRHGRDKKGDRLYALYGHVRNISVKVGQRVKRGQQIAEVGEDIFTGCGGGLHHLHFQLSYSSTQIPLGWGWASFVADGARAPNPHKYWENGEGNITCFEEGKWYSSSGLTYPLPCINPGIDPILVWNNNENEFLPGAKVLAQGQLPQEAQSDIALVEKKTESGSLEEEFISSGVSHFALTPSQAMALFSSMSDGPESVDDE